MHADKKLPAKDLGNAVGELVRQMLAAGAYVSPNTVSASVAAGGANIGNGALVTSTKDGLGRILEYQYAEKLEFKVTSSATAGAEVWNAKGEVAQGDRLGQLWPAGSGSDKQHTTLDAASATKIANGAFDTFTVANTPDNWTIAVGAAGVELFSEAGTVYKGAKALKIAGGATLTQLYQAPTGLKAKTPYAVNFWARVSAAPATGVLTVDLHDGTSVIADEAGTATVTAANDYAGKWQTMFWRVFDMPSLALILPSAGSVLVNDSLLA